MAINNPALSGRVITTFFYYVLPSIVGLMAITSVSLVDGIFVGNAVGADALAAITLMLPYFTFLIAIAIMLAIGGAVTAGKAIGENNVKAASNIFSQSLIAAVVINIIFALASIPLLDFLGSLLSIPSEIMPLVTEYLDIIRWVFILQLTTMVLYYFVRADGHPVLATVSLLAGAVINIVLDAWFIIYLDLGLSGAAYATAIAQVMQFLVLSQYFLSKHKTLTFTLIQRDWLLLAKSAYNGVSEFINEISVGIIFFIINALMITRLGIDGVAAFTLINYFIFLSVMLSYGFADALHLVVSQNFGAKHLKRVQLFLSTAIVSTVSLGLLLALLLIFGSEVILQWFVDDADAHVYQVSSQLLPVLLPLFLVNGTNIILTSYLTAVHQPKPSALLAVMRSLFLPAILLMVFYFYLPGMNILPKAINDLSFIIALPVAEWCAFMLAIYLCYQYRPATLKAKT